MAKHGNRFARSPRSVAMRFAVFQTNALDSGTIVPAPVFTTIHRLMSTKYVPRVCTCGFNLDRRFFGSATYDVGERNPKILLE